MYFISGAAAVGLNLRLTVLAAFSVECPVVDRTQSDADNAPVCHPALILSAADSTTSVFAGLVFVIVLLFLSAADIAEAGRFSASIAKI